MKEGLKRILRQVYRFSFKPFLKKGIYKRIGDAGTFRLDYIFAFSDFSTLGRRHNSGFARWLEACKEKITIFDVGAYIGLYSIPADSVINKAGYIYAFEPSLANRSYLERHIRFNNAGNIKVFPYIVGRENLNNAIFYENQDVDGMNSIAIRKNRHLYNEVLKRQVSLDDFCLAQGLMPEVIKIDAEGAELNILIGAGRILKRCYPIIFLSAHPKRLKAIGQSADELISFVNGLGYAVYNADGERVERFNFNEYILIPQGRNFYEIF